MLSSSVLSPFIFLSTTRMTESWKRDTIPVLRVHKYSESIINSFLGCFHYLIDLKRNRAKVFGRIKSFSCGEWGYSSCITTENYMQSH